MADLRELAGRLAALAVEEAAPRAIRLTGSVARGEDDEWSDVDLILYYDALPGEAQREAIRVAAGGGPAQAMGASDSGVVEQYVVDGTYCQLAHVTVAGWERDLDQALAGEESELPSGKMVAGLFESEALHGADLVEAWRSRSAYPDALRRTLVERHWRIFPLWFIEGSMRARDAEVWMREVLVEAAFDLLGVLSALNGVWFSRFQLKQTRGAVDKLAIAPPRLYERLLLLASGEIHAAVLELEGLVEETAALVAEHLPEAQIPFGRRPGERLPARPSL